MIVPVLYYGCGAWYTGSQLSVRKLDQIQERAIGYQCGLPRTAPLAGVEGEVAWTPPAV